MHSCGKRENPGFGGPADVNGASGGDVVLVPGYMLGCPVLHYLSRELRFELNPMDLHP